MRSVLHSKSQCPLHCSNQHPPHSSSPLSIIWLSSALSSILSCVSISSAGGRVSSPAYYLSLNRSGLEVVLANSRAGGSHTMCRHVHVRCWDSGLGRAAAIYLLTCAPFIISRHLTYKERNQQQPRRTRCAAVAAMTGGEPTLEIFCGPKQTA